MTERRYFYTDALAAAWMAQHFGMRFEGRSFCIDALIGNGADGRTSWFEGIVFVHADSLHLLEPIPTEETADGYILRDLCHVLHRGRDYYGSYHECLGFCGGMDTIRVVQRNGIPFMWPESEAAESLSA